MAFKMRSGNKPEFKNIGSSPMKIIPIEQAALQEANVGDEDVGMSRRELRKKKKSDKKIARHQKREDRKAREAEERRETGIGGVEQLINRVGDWADKKSKTWVGRQAKGVLNTLIDPYSTDAGTLLKGGKQMYGRIKDAIKGELGVDPITNQPRRLFTGEGGLLRQGQDLFRTIRNRRDARLMDPANTSPAAIRYRKKFPEGRNTVAVNSNISSGPGGGPGGPPSSFNKKSKYKKK